VQKVFFYELKLSHNRSVTDGRTDGWQLVPIARPLLKYGGLKIGKKQSENI